jgi:hypothetical protein
MTQCWRCFGHAITSTSCSVTRKVQSVVAIKMLQKVRARNWFQFVVAVTVLNSTWYITDSPHNHHKNTVFRITVICPIESVDLFISCTTLCIVPMGLIGTTMALSWSRRLNNYILHLGDSLCNYIHVSGISEIEITFSPLCSLIWNVEFDPFGQKWCKIWGSQIGNYDDHWLFRCDTVLSGRCIATFRTSFATSTIYPWSRDSSVGIATGYGLDGRGVGVRVPVEAKFFSSPRRPERLWAPPNLLPNAYRGLFPLG